MLPITASIVGTKPIILLGIGVRDAVHQPLQKSGKSMSCYNWCSGTIKIPTKEWSSFRKALIARHNEYLNQAYLTARKIYEEIKSDSKYKRDYRYQEAVHTKLYNMPNMSFPAHIRDLIYMSLTAGSYPNIKLALPKKKDFPKANLNTTDYGYFTLDHNSKSISYYVDENNRAVERASEDMFVKYVFRLFHRINWTRNSGGKIIGNDEYNRDSDYEGGGGNYVVYSFGPDGQKQNRFFDAYYR